MLGALLRPVPMGRIFGIPLLVVPAALLLLALPLLLASQSGSAGTLSAFILVLALVVGLLVHEMAHALVARKLGLTVLDVTIWPLGGMARLAGLHERPQAEAPVAAAGPLANLLLALAAWPLPGEAASGVTLVNLLLGLGNLVPLFPLDGGRIVRAFLARRSPFVDATRAAIPSFGLMIVATVVLCWVSGMILLPILLAIYLLGSGMNELIKSTLTFGPPTMTRAEVWRRAFRRLPTTASASVVAEEVPTHPLQRDATEPVELDAEPVHSDLEHFRGSLDEFFRERD